jgi:hypothetical protein
MVMKKIKNSKKGWIEIVEVFITIFLLTGVLFVVLKNSSSSENLLTPIIYEQEISILREIELNNTLRTEILSVLDTNLPLEWGDFNSTLPNVYEKIISMTPSNLECVSKLCTLNDLCTSNDLPHVSVYVKSSVISADLNTYSPRQLKLFCIEGQ